LIIFFHRSRIPCRSRFGKLQQCFGRLVQVIVSLLLRCTLDLKFMHAALSCSSAHPCCSFKWKGGSVSNSTPRDLSAPPINCTFEIISDRTVLSAASLPLCTDANLWTPPPPLDLTPIVAPAVLAPTALAALIYIVRRFMQWRKKSQHQRRVEFSQVHML
jgi:hypothetical protein